MFSSHVYGSVRRIIMSENEMMFVSIFPVGYMKNETVSSVVPSFIIVLILQRSSCFQKNRCNGVGNREHHTTRGREEKANIIRSPTGWRRIIMQPNMSARLLLTRRRSGVILLRRRLCRLMAPTAKRVLPLQVRPDPRRRKILVRRTITMLRTKWYPTVPWRIFCKQQPRALG